MRLVGWQFVMCHMYTTGMQLRRPKYGWSNPNVFTVCQLAVTMQHICTIWCLSHTNVTIMHSVKLTWLSAISQSVPYSSPWTGRPSAGQFPHLLFSHRDLNAASVEHSGDVLLKSIHYTTQKYPLMYSWQEQILKVFPYQALYTFKEYTRIRNAVFWLPDQHHLQWLQSLTCSIV